MKFKMKRMTTSFYEGDRAMGEYLLFHYGEAKDVLPELAFDSAFDSASRFSFHSAFHSALNYPVRCVSAFVKHIDFTKSTRALDLGCAVGRSTFELARFCGEVIGMDSSKRFIQCANQLRHEGQIRYRFLDHGSIFQETIAKIPAGIDPQRVAFEEGNALFLREGLGSFDVILMANLIDRLIHPSQCLRSMASRIRSKGHLILTSPYTWLEEFTPQSEWIGGKRMGEKSLSTLDALKDLMGDAFDLICKIDLPFVLREHSRKFQWSIAEGTLWRKRD